MYRSINIRTVVYSEKCVTVEIPAIEKNRKKSSIWNSDNIYQIDKSMWTLCVPRIGFACAKFCLSQP